MLNKDKTQTKKKKKQIPRISESWEIPETKGGKNCSVKKKGMQQICFVSVCLFLC